MQMMLNYRKEEDGKFHLDIDGSDRFGFSFSTIDEMREAISQEYGFVDVTNYCCPFCGSKPDHEPNGEECNKMMVERHHEEITLKKGRKRDDRISL